MSEIRKHEQLRFAYDNNAPLRSVAPIIGTANEIDDVASRSSSVFKEKLPQFENYARRFDKSLVQNTNEKIAFHYYIQQSIRNVLRRLAQQQNRMEAIKRILHANHLLPAQKDMMRSFILPSSEPKR